MDSNKLTQLEKIKLEIELKDVQRNKLQVIKDQKYADAAALRDREREIFRLLGKEPKKAQRGMQLEHKDFRNGFKARYNEETGKIDVESRDVTGDKVFRQLRKTTAGDLALAFYFTKVKPKKGQKEISPKIKEVLFTDDNLHLNSVRINLKDEEGAIKRINGIMDDSMFVRWQGNFIPTKRDEKRLKTEIETRYFLGADPATDHIKRTDISIVDGTGSIARVDNSNRLVVGTNNTIGSGNNNLVIGTSATTSGKITIGRVTPPDTQLGLGLHGKQFIEVSKDGEVRIDGRLETDNAAIGAALRQWAVQSSREMYGNLPEPVKAVMKEETSIFKKKEEKKSEEFGGSLKGALKTRWSPELAQDISSLSNVDAEQELLNLVVAGLSMELKTSDLIGTETAEELKERMDKLGYRMSPTVYDPNTFTPYKLWIPKK